MKENYPLFANSYAKEMQWVEKKTCLQFKKKKDISVFIQNCLLLSSSPRMNK